MWWQKGILIGITVAFVVGIAGSEEVSPKTRMIASACGVAVLGIIFSM